VTQALTNPEATEAYGVLEPENLEIQRELLGVHDWVIPGAESGDKQMMEIELLLKSRPTPNVDAIKAYAADQAIEGASPSKQRARDSSAKDSAAECHADVSVLDSRRSDVGSPQLRNRKDRAVPFVFRWDRRGEKQQVGILNVKLHGMEHKAAKAAQAPPRARFHRCRRKRAYTSLHRSRHQVDEFARTRSADAAIGDL